MKHSSLFNSFSIVFLIVVITNCESTNDLILSPPPKPPTVYVPPPKISTAVDLVNYRLKATQLTKDVMNETDRYLGKNDMYIYINYERLVRSSIAELRLDFEIPNIDYNSFAKSVVNNSKVIPYDGTIFNLSTQFPDISIYYNNYQISFLNKYFNDMYNADDLNTAVNYYTTIKNSVNNNTSLNSDQKIAVLGIIEYANEYAKRYFSGEWQFIYNDIINVSGLNVSKPCSINWRDVWRSAVAGGVVSGIIGAYAGGTAGSVTVPVLGTASGAVAGGVFGFAAGFTSGAAMAVGTQLFFGCLMRSPVKAPDWQCQDFEYFKENLDHCLTETNDKKVFYELTKLTL